MVSFGSVPWVTTIDRLDCTAFMIVALPVVPRCCGGAGEDEHVPLQQPHRGRTDEGGTEEGSHGDRLVLCTCVVCVAV